MAKLHDLVLLVDQ